MRRAFITGTSGFIGFHLARLMLDQGWQVHGFDGMTSYYDIALKRARLALLQQNQGFTQTEAMLEDAEAVMQAAQEARPDVIVHLAAQAGVRYSLEAPRAYIDSNLTGTFNVMEAARALKVGHLLMASTSSVYGANEEMPFRETDKADHPLTIYAATKKANEAMGHAYAHLHDLPVTMFRFFTVYGPWGRPDMAPMLFARAILAGEPIRVFNKCWQNKGNLRFPFNPSLFILSLFILSLFILSLLCLGESLHLRSPIYFVYAGFSPYSRAYTSSKNGIKYCDPTGAEKRHCFRFLMFLYCPRRIFRGCAT
jgi:nucleoside-diphosphate-sugar epimerase